MTYKKLDEGFNFNIKVKTALDQIFKNTMIFVKAMKMNGYIKENNQDLEKRLDVILQEAEYIRNRIVQDKSAHAEEIMKLANDLNKTTELLKRQKMDDNKGDRITIANNMSLVMPQPRGHHIDFSVPKQILEIQKNTMQLLTKVRAAGKMLREHVPANQRVFWNKLAQACEDFSASAKNKILNLFRRLKFTPESETNLVSIFKGAPQAQKIRQKK